MFFKNFLSFFKKDETPYLLYSDIVAASRQEKLYEEMGVPDTLEGRFEMIALHASLFFCRLKTEDENNRALGQAVFDVMFADLDYNLREMGVGDLSVGKRIKKLAKAFYSRLERYDIGLQSNSDKKLRDLLNEHNITEQASNQKKIISYIRASYKDLQNQKMGTFLKGNVKFKLLD